MAYPVSLFETEQDDVQTQDWTFALAPTRELTHCYHDYPARMIPQVAGKLLDAFAPQAKTLFDPYCGSGTSLVEGMIRGINVVGADLNPLACLISKTKTAVVGLHEIERRILSLEKFVASPQNINIPIQIPGISRLDFWFKPQVIESLSVIKSFIDELPDENTRLFFQVAFSETVRESSNTRNDEFKLYRYDALKLERFEPDVFGTMTAKLKRNLSGLKQFLVRLRNLKRIPNSNVYELNTASSSMSHIVAEASVDVLITSPPYGDSHTTVAYGQYSRLSAAWLNLQSPESVDRRLMGGSLSKNIAQFPCRQLNESLELIKSEDEKRAREVAAFYSHLYDSISHVSRLIKRGGHVCYVVGNRKVKGIVLPTDDAIRNFFECFDFTHVNTFHRSIPNKRMPLRNSPTNAVGVVENTMTNEYIIVMRQS